MSESGVTILMSAIPGVRILGEEELEDGSMVALRKGGDEILFASWENDEKEHPKGMVWIPVSEFSPDPEAIRPPEIQEGPDPALPDDAPESAPAEDGTSEKPGNPFGRNLRKRPGLDKSR